MNRRLTILIPVFCFLISVGGTAQSPDRIYPVAQEMPMLPGCEEVGEPSSHERRNCTKEKIREFVEENMRYPKEALEARQEGAVVVSFVVMADGTMSDLEVVDDPGYGMGDEALRMMKKLKKGWIPGTDKGEAVNVRMRVPVNFVLPVEEDEPVQPESVIEREYYTLLDTMPYFADCLGDTTRTLAVCTRDMVFAYLRKNLEYPDSAVVKGIEGTVMTRFIVDEEGEIGSVEVIETLSPECDAEAIRLVSAMRGWSPGLLNGKPVKSQMELPVRFRLPAAANPGDN